MENDVKLLNYRRERHQELEKLQAAQNHLRYLKIQQKRTRRATTEAKRKFQKCMDNKFRHESHTTLKRHILKKKSDRVKEVKDQVDKLKEERKLQRYHTMDQLMTNKKQQAHSQRIYSKKCNEYKKQMFLNNVLTKHLKHNEILCKEREGREKVEKFRRNKLNSLKTEYKSKVKRERKLVTRLQSRAGSLEERGVNLASSLRSSQQKQANALDKLTFFFPENFYTLPRPQSTQTLI